MFVAVHGEVTPHPWRDGRVASADAYSLFVARCSAMGWLTEAREHTFDGFWSMNDAGQDAGPHTRVAWFQVSLTEPVHAGRPLPVQPFLSCAHDVVARSGALRLRAVQVLLAVQSLAERPPAGALADLLQDAGWFADAE